MSDDYAAWRSDFAEAMDPRFYNIGHLDSLLSTGQAQFWTGEKSALVTEIKEFPGGARALHFLVAAGSLAELTSQLRPACEAWGKSQGCDLALIESREGWAREMKPHGYDTFQVSIVKEL